MVAAFLTVLFVAVLQCAPAGAAPARPLCLGCHSVHYAERGVCTGCHRGNPASGRRNIAHQRLIAGRYAAFSLGDTPQLRSGERLIEQFACRRCHVIGGRGNRLSADLDRAVARTAPEAIEASILQPVQNMPDFRVSKQQAVLLVNALLSASARAPAGEAGQRQIVHFDRTGTVGKDIFSSKCGPCHRALTRRAGGLGQGDAGPNLSGLLSPYYPLTFRGRDRWNVKDLEVWLKNPRTVRPWAAMQPVRLTESEFRELVDILEMGGNGVK